MARVCLNKLTKTYPNGFQAVKGIDLEIQSGEFVVLVGPSGCGKSTTLRMIAGLENATSGDLMINDQLVNDTPAQERNITMVFQNYALYPHMTVYDNMAFCLKNRGHPRSVIEERVGLAAETLGLNEMLARKPGQLSGGQRQRVAVGRAIVRNADVFLFDEPLSNLDAKMRNQMRYEISKLHKKLGGKTMIYVTHDQVEAMTLGDRIVVMNGGEIQQVSTPVDLYQNPASKYVAGFLGSPGMNFLSGKIDPTGMMFEENSGQIKLPLSVDWRSRLQGYRGKAVTLGFRPEHVAVTSRDQSATSPIHAEVEVRENMGNEIIMHLDGRTSTGTPILARVSPSDAVSNRDQVALRVDPEFFKFFDAETDATI